MRTGVILGCVIAAFFTTGLRASDPPQEVAGLDEVVVEGSRNELNRLRAQAIEFEDRFYERFNELNTIDDFDTHCHLEARIGTKLKQRYCRAVFQDKAYLKEGQEYTEFRQRSENGFGGSLGPPPPAYVAIQVRMEQYRDNMREVVAKNPELLELVRKRYEAEKKYDAARRRIFGLAPADESAVEDQKPAAPP